MNPFPNCYSHYMDTLVLANWARALLLIYHGKAVGRWSPSRKVLWPFGLFSYIS